MHRLAHAHIENFRSCRDVKVDLSEFTAIVGYNNGGKSNILTALQWFLKPDTLTQVDFWDPNLPVQVTATVEGVDSAVLPMLSAANQKKVQPFLADGVLKIRRTCAVPGTNGSNTTVDIRDPAVADDADNDAWKANPGGIWSAISKMFPEPLRIGAMEDSAEDAAKFKTTTTLGRLIAEVTEPIITECSADFEKAVKTVADRLDADGSDRPKSLQDFDSEATAAASDFFPGVTLRLHVPPLDVRDFFKAGTIKVYEGSQQRDFAALGHGAQRSIQMALIKTLAERKATPAPGSTTRLLLIDEPELYLHPHGIEQIRDALRTLSTKGYQVIFSTHSALMIEESDVPAAAMVYKESSKGTVVRTTLASAVAQALSDNAAQAKMLFSLAHASQILFAERVLLAEGDTEKRLLPILFQTITGTRMRTAKVAMISQGGVGHLHKAFDVLSALGLPAKGVVDLDYAFRGGRRAGLICQTDPDFTACIPIITALSQHHGFLVDTEGLPTRGGAMNAAEAFEILAKNPQAQPHINNLHAKLLAKNVFMWPGGAIEAHLGIAAKNESAWATYAARLKNEKVEDVVVDLPTVTKFVQWASTF